MATGTLTSKGQTTIPKDIRDGLGLKTGDQLMFEIEDGKIVVTPKTGSIRDLFGIYHDPKRKPLTIEEMDEAIGRAVIERYERSLPRKRRKRAG